ncbi:Surfeit locus protein 1 [Actinoplanes sp. SE50]|nr:MULTISPECIES: SURF1 family protein [unclassified Actinoplanes]AEV82197.1 Surfeit locus protein 1 [Actinoplanes sp. SE50/110]ATO80596.1 Surfeit locus protein 1 [Actinoplanes sp. SE50]SLL98002.1 Surfeit locus protein 1 [Actinoplanes sp. SE50/110]
MYRFLLTPRWLATAVLAVVASVIMVMLGNWQLRRYHERSEINARIDAADSTPAVPMTSKLAAPTVQGTPGASPGKAVAWTKVTVTGRYDPAHEIQARGRTVNGDVGFEIVTPLMLADGTAVLVDRGWVPPAAAGALAPPQAPPAPTGQVTVVGQVHLSESRPAPIERRDGRWDTRRINVPRLAHELPFPVYGAYVLLTSQTPANDPAFAAVPIDHEDAWQNGGYAVQWWLFSVMALALWGYQARREAHGVNAPAGERPEPAGEPVASPAPRTRDRVAEVEARRAKKDRPRDRVDDADQRRASKDRPRDRVDVADRRRASKDRPRDRVEEADLRAAAGKAAEPVDRVEEADRRLAAQNGAD